jgi:outer membrane biosynthesis protein TonB
MMKYQHMQASFEKEKNLKASAYTGTICVLLFLLFFFLQWTLPQIPPPSFGEGIEVNLGDSETGLGDLAPQSPGEPSATAETRSATPQSTPQTAEQKVQPDEYEDGDAPSVKKSETKTPAKPVTETKTAVKKPTNTAVVNPTPAPPRPKAVFKGGTSTTSSGNRADSYNGVRDQGVAGGRGDQGNPNGNPNSDSYKGNAASGNGGAGGTGGVSIRSGLNGRRITRLPSFEDDFNENAKVAVDITVDPAGNVTAAIVNPRGTTTTNQNIRNIAIRKARNLKLNTGSEEQTGTLVFNFKLRG